MRILHGERGTGKSLKCIEYAWATDSIIVCANVIRKQHLITMAKEWNMEDVQIVCMSELNQKNSGIHKSLIIDDVEDLLSVLLYGEKISLVTTSCEIRELPKG